MRSFSPQLSTCQPKYPTWSSPTLECVAVASPSVWCFTTPEFRSRTCALSRTTGSVSRRVGFCCCFVSYGKTVINFIFSAVFVCIYNTYIQYIMSHIRISTLWILLLCIYVNQRVKFDALRLSATPFGQLPLLEIDGKVLAQSWAIYRYVARLADLEGKNSVEAAFINQAAETFRDYFDTITPYIRAKFGFAKGDAVCFEKRRSF